jgi:hypothetical protein
MGGPLSFEQVEKELRKKSFGVLGTVSPSGKSQSTGIAYALSTPQSTFSLYVITEKRTVKARNISTNPNVSFVIPFPHHLLRFVPANVVQFQGTAEILPFSHEEAIRSFESTRVLRMTLEQAQQMDEDELVFIRVLPRDHLNIYGLGFGILQMTKDLTVCLYDVKIPDKRRIDSEATPDQT